MNTKKMEMTFWASAVCMCLMALSFLLMPIASSRAFDGESWWLVMSGALFWISLIAGYLLLYITNRWRKKGRNNARLPSGIKTWGAFRLMTNFYALIAEAVFVLSFIGFLIFVIFNSGSYVMYIFLCLTVLAFHMHCMFNGVNYKAVCKAKTNLYRKKQEGVSNGTV